MASLWLPGCTPLAERQITTATSDTFVALAGNRTAGQILRRSRIMTHLLGPAPQCTHPASAIIYTWTRGLWRALATGRLPPNIWRARWPYRRTATLGPLHQPRAALKHLGIIWSAPFVFKCRGATLDFSVPQSVLDDVGQPASLLLRRPAFSRLLHRLWEFLRDAMTSSEALRRPKDFKGLENGMEARFTIREHTYAMMLCRSGPSLLTRGVWTKP